MSDTPTESTPATGAEPQPADRHFPLPEVGELPRLWPHCTSAYFCTIARRLRDQSPTNPPNAQ